MDRIMLSVLLALIILVPMSQSQRGGGRSSGGSSSFGGGRSFGGGFYNGGYYGRRTSCIQRCMGNPTCIQSCQTQTSTAGIIVGSIFGSCCLCGLLSFLCISCKSKGFCKNCCYSDYQSIKQQFNTIDPNAMSQQEYLSKRNRILYLINQSRNLNTFSFQQGGQHAAIKASAQITKQSQYYTEMKIEGHDKYGGWTADGYILPRDGRIFMWFYKEYDDKDYAQQTDQWQHLIYQSYAYDQYQGLKGRWYYRGFENNPQYSGEWKLFGQGNVMTNMAGQIISYPPRY